ncbi:MAG TPA: flagellar protein FlaF, partial [Methanomicrobiales archaeon]|nr:flagellar protein FlaF [Methanomicrobiales archaeon]
MVEMATATLIATAIGLIILVVTAYVLIGGTLSAAEIVASAQKDTAGLQEARMRTSIAITGTALDTNSTTLYMEVENTGSEIIG